MASFTYLAREGSGREQTGTVQAPSHAAAVRMLRAQGLLVLEAREARLQGEISWNPLDYRPIADRDIQEAFHQLAVLLRSGVDLLSALELTAEHSRAGVRPVWQDAAAHIRDGGSLSDALAQRQAFAPVVVQLIRVGEQTGNLDQVLDQAALEIERRRAHRNQFVSALAYPLFVVVFAIGVTAFMLTTVVPEIRKFLAVMGRKMPPITQSLIDVSSWLEQYALAILVGLVVLLVTFALLYRWPPARLEIDRLALRLPVFGGLFRLSGTVIFSRTLGTLLRAGVRILEALETVEGLHRNQYLAQRVGEARRRVMRGSSLAEPLADRFGFMPLLTRMVVVGEASGRLDQILEEMCEYHDELLQRHIKRMSNILAPVVTIVVGGIVGFVYAAFLVAMFAAAGGGSA